MYISVVLNDLVKTFGKNQNLKLGLMQRQQVRQISKKQERRNRNIL